MKTSFKQKLFWLIPLIITVVSLSMLYFTNLQRYTTPPSDDWSREYSIATMDSYFTPQLEATDNVTNIYYVEDGKLIRKSLNEDFKEVSKADLPISITGFDDFFVNGEHVYFYDEGTIIDGSSNEVLDQADLFYRASNGNILYAKGQDIYKLDTNTNEKKKLFSADHPVESINSFEDLVLVYSSNLNRGIYSIYHVSANDNYELVLTDEINVGVANKITQLAFTVKENTIHFAVTAETQNSTNKKYFFYYSSFPLDDPEVELVQIEPKDPITNRALQNLSHIQLRTVDGQLQMLFRSVGFTFKDTNDKSAMNIYLMTFLNDGQYEVKRLSNTYSVSSEPMFIGKEAILWKESAGTNKYHLYLGTTNKNIVEQAKHISTNEYLIALGMTISSLSTSIFVLLLVLGWLIVPIAYLIIANFVLRIKGRNHDLNNSKKIYYIGVIVYILNALVLQRFLFPATAYRTAPDYLTFTGSNYVYILLFALISFISVQVIKRDWGTIGKYMYFIGIQILCYLLILGPYYF